jgi:hypothetical protein
MHIHLLKDAHAQNGENAVNAGLQAELPLYNQQERVYTEGAPDLDFDGVGLTSEEGLDSDVHFKPFEEELDSPARFVKQRDGECGQVEVVGEKNQQLPCFRIAVDNAAKARGVVLLGADNRESDDLVGDDALALRRAGMTAVELQIRFGASDKVGASLVDAPETSKIDVAPVEQIKAAGFKEDRVEPVDVMDFPVGNVHQDWQGPAQIELGVNLDGRLARAEAGPRENRQAKIDRSRVDRVNRGLQFIDPAGVAGAQFSRTGDEQQRKLLEDPAVAGRIGVGQSAARNRAAETEVIELLLARSQAVLQIAQAFPKGKQGESESQQVVPRRERGGLIVTSILRDDASKITLWQEVDDLREYETSRMHGHTLYSKSEPKRPKSNGVITHLPLSGYQSAASHRAEIAARISAL